MLIVAVVIQGALVPRPGSAGSSRVRMPLCTAAGGARAASSCRRGAVAHAVGEADAVARRTRAGERRSASRSGRRLARLQPRFPLIQLLALVAVFVYGVITLPGLGAWISIRSILVLAALVGLASCGQTLLILMGGFDLGVSGFIVAGALTSPRSRSSTTSPSPTALAIALLAARCSAAFAGYICHRFRIQPLIVTLAMGTIALGLVKVQIGGRRNGYPPQWLIDLAEPVTKTFGIGHPADRSRSGSSSRSSVRDLPAPHALWPQPVRDRREPARGRLRADQHPPRLDRRVRVQRRRPSALVGVLIGGFARQRRRQRRRPLPVPERRRGDRRRHGLRRPRRLHADRRSARCS